MSQIYRHYKNKLYKYIGIAKHSETLEDLVVYETRYKNDQGSLWVRPKDMYFSQIDIGRGIEDRFAPVHFDIENHTLMDQALLNRLQPLVLDVFSDMSSEKLQAKAQLPQGLLTLALYQEKIVGFKWGYAESPELFYSWLGAIDKSWHGFGLGKVLMDEQHKKCRELGYKKVRTKTMNRWRQMLLLNIKMGFSIIGTEGSTEDELKIILEKSLE